MIRHIVALRFLDSTTKDTKENLYSELADLSSHIEGIHDFRAFSNESVEHPLVRGFKDLFWFDFKNLDVRDAYLADPVHQAIGARIVDEVQGGADGIFVFDVTL